VKIGAENKKQMRVMIALLVVLLFVGIYNFVDFGTSSAASPASSSPSQPKKPGGAQLADSTLDPRLHWPTLIASQSIKYEPGRNIFKMEEPKIEAVAGDVRGSRPPIDVPMAPTPTPTPPAPPIPLKFYGFASKPNEQKKIFLDHDGEVYVVRQGDIVERKYKVVQINNTNVLIEDVLNNSKETIQLTAR